MKFEKNANTEQKSIDSIIKAKQSKNQNQNETNHDVINPFIRRKKKLPVNKHFSFWVF